MCSLALISCFLKELERTEEMYRGLVGHARRVLMGYFDLVRVCKGEGPDLCSALQLKLSLYNPTLSELGDEFCKIGVREPQKAANEAFCEFGEYHRQMEKFGISMLKKTKPILSDLGTYLTKVSDSQKYVFLLKIN